MDNVLDLLRQAGVASPPAEVLIAEPGPAPAGALRPDRARFFLMAAGCRHMSLLVDGRVTTVPFTPQRALFAPAGSWHKPMPREAHDLVTVIFDPDYTSVERKRYVSGAGYEQFAGLQRPPGFRLPVSPLIEALSRLASQPADARPGAAGMLRALVELVLAEFADADSRRQLASVTWQSVNAHLHENFDQPIDRSSVGAAVGLHPNHVSRLCRQHAGMGFSAYLTELRLEHACVLLARTDLMIGEVARQSGYRDPNYFGKVFRRAYGVSPGRFRKQRC